MDTQTTARVPSVAATVVVCTLGYSALGWVLNGLGAVLPALDDDVGSIAVVYPLVPGAAMLLSALTITTRQRRRHGAGSGDARTVAIAFGALAAMLLAMGVTRWPAFSLLATGAMALAAAAMARLLPGVIAALGRGDTNRRLMRANGFASLAGVVAPLAVGSSIALGLGWRVGYAGPVLAGAITVAVLVGRPAARPSSRPDDDPDPLALSRPDDDGGGADGTGWTLPVATLTVAIMVEFCFTYFAATYLSEELGLSNAVAAAGGAAWGIGMAVGRLATRAGGGLPVPVSVGVVAIGFAAMWLVTSPSLAIAGFAVAGLGVAPLYPNRLTALIDRFPAAPHRGATFGLLSSGLALVTSPAIMAALRGASDVRTAYLAVPVLLVALLGLAALETRR